MANRVGISVLNVRVADPIKDLVTEFAHIRGISQAAATSWLLVSGARAEGLNTAAIETPATRTA